MFVSSPAQDEGVGTEPSMAGSGLPAWPRGLEGLDELPVPSPTQGNVCKALLFSSCGHGNRLGYIKLD